MALTVGRRKLKNFQYLLGEIKNVCKFETKTISPMHIEWRPVAGYEDLYQVGDIGVVKSLHRIKNKYLTPRVKDGYIVVSLSKNGTDRQIPIHRLVAIAFIPNPENKPAVNHINGIRLDNRIGNLEWVTIKENTIHAFNMGLTKYKLKTEPKIIKKLQPGWKPHNLRAVDKLSVSGDYIETYESIKEAAQKNLVSSCTIHNFINRKANPRKKTVAGFKWRYTIEKV